MIFNRWGNGNEPTVNPDPVVRGKTTKFLATPNIINFAK